MFITGTDEVGRGCIAGPIVAASFGLYLDDLIDLRILLENKLNIESRSLHKKKIQRTISLLENDINLITKAPVTPGVTSPSTKRLNETGKETRASIKPKYNTELLQFVYDSKKISEKYRIDVTKMLTMNKNYGIGVVSNTEIDKSGLQSANLKAMNKSLKHLQYCNSTLSAQAGGPVLHLFDQVAGSKDNYICITKGDQNSFVIAAASIIAKTYRDELMKKYDEIYPKYGFKNHVGYGTKAHLEAVSKYGPCPIHRVSYEIFR